MSSSESTPVTPEQIIPPDPVGLTAVNVGESVYFVSAAGETVVSDTGSGRVITDISDGTQYCAVYQSTSGGENITLWRSRIYDAAGKMLCDFTDGDAAFADGGHILFYNYEGAKGTSDPALGHVLIIDAPSGETVAALDGLWYRDYAGVCPRTGNEGEERSLVYGMDGVFRFEAEPVSGSAPYTHTLCRVDGVDYCCAKAGQLSAIYDEEGRRLRGYSEETAEYFKDSIISLQAHDGETALLKLPTFFEVGRLTASYFFGCGDRLLLSTSAGESLCAADGSAIIPSGGKSITCAPLDEIGMARGGKLFKVKYSDDREYPCEIIDADGSVVKRFKSSVDCLSAELLLFDADGEKGGRGERYIYDIDGNKLTDTPYKSYVPLIFPDARESGLLLGMHERDSAGNFNADLITVEGKVCLTDVTRAQAVESGYILITAGGSTGLVRPDGSWVVSWEE